MVSCFLISIDDIKMGTFSILCNQKIKLKLKVTLVINMKPWDSELFNESAKTKTTADTATALPFVDKIVLPNGSNFKTPFVQK